MKRVVEHGNLHEGKKGKYLKSWVYGGLDGIITTFAVVAGVIGASLSSSIILILGFANLIADGISMAVGDYLSTKSENEYYFRERYREEQEIKNNLKREEDQTRKIYSEKGILGKDFDKILGVFRKHKNFWIDSMMHEELDLKKPRKDALRHGVVTFSSFLMFGLIPLFIFVIEAIFGFNLILDFTMTIMFTGIAMFVLGAIKTRITGKNWIKSGLETLLVGGFAAGIAYLIGWLLSGIV